MSHTVVQNDRQISRKRGGCRTWFVRLLTGGVVAVVALIASTALYQIIAQGGDEARFPAPGQIVNVNGADMHIHCIGEGEVTVILEAGANAYSDDWAVVQSMIGAFTRTCAYDRAGLGWSELGGDEPTPETVARRLRELLAAAGITPPYALVGHSVGGAYVRMFAALYPEEVAGLVFVDARHESLEPVDQTEEENIQAREAYESSLTLYRVLRDTGIARLFGLSLGRSVNPALNHYPDEVVYRMVLFSVRETTLQAMMRESRAGDADNDALRAAAVPETLPVYVLTAQSSLEETGWENAQAQLAALSANSVWQVVPHSTHSLHAEQPDAVVAAVRRVIEAIRTGNPLAEEA